MPKHQLLRQVKAKSLSVKIPKNEPNTAVVAPERPDTVTGFRELR